MAIAAARLNHRICFLEPATTYTAANEAVTTWSPRREAWAEVKQTAADETLSDGRIITRMKHTIIIRYRADIDETLRIQHGGRLLEIGGVIVRSRNEELEIIAHEVRA
jgi:SPP1 family predicted phage head-tail adaptor